MSVTRERQAHARRDGREHVGIVGEDQDRRGVVHSGKRFPHVGRRFLPVPEAYEPDTGKPDRFVAKNANPSGHERFLDPVSVEPPIVIAQNSIDPKRCSELSENRGKLLGRDEGAAQYAVDDIVVREHHEVGGGGIRFTDDLSQLIETAIGRAYVYVCEKCYLEPVEFARPAGRRELVAPHREGRRLIDERPQAERQDGGEKDPKRCSPSHETSMPNECDDYVTSRILGRSIRCGGELL